MTINRIRNFFDLPFASKLLFFEALLTLSTARVTILIFSFKRISKKLGRVGIESSSDLSSDKLKEVQTICKAVKKASNYVFFRAMCLEQGLTGKIMLNRRQISSTLYLGVNKDDQAYLKAHAWLRAGNHIFLGKKGMKKFKVISYFGTEF